MPNEVRAIADTYGTTVEDHEAAPAQTTKPPSPADAALFRAEQSGMTRKDLEPLIGSRARVSEILTGARQLTLPMIRRIHSTLKIPLASLVAEEPRRAG